MPSSSLVEVEVEFGVEVEVWVEFEVGVEQKYVPHIRPNVTFSLFLLLHHLYYYIIPVCHVLVSIWLSYYKSKKNIYQHVIKHSVISFF